MQITEYVCDECGKKRMNDTNHWRTILNYPSAQSRVRLVVGSLGMKNEFVDAEEEDVCGQDCAVKAFSRWLSTGKLKADKTEGALSRDMQVSMRVLEAEEGHGKS